VLTLARFESGAVHPSFAEVELSSAVRKVVARLSPLLAEQAIRCRFTPQDDFRIRVDQMLFENMLENIISNAAKYSRPGGVIEIVTSADAGGIRCRISFYRAEESRTSAVPGSGLGLAIVKKLAELQNILIDLESVLGKGTIVTLLFGDAAGLQRNVG
jgi:two-component system heavy metal sensor histidine kinase CusS